MCKQSDNGKTVVIDRSGCSCSVGDVLAGFIEDNMGDDLLSYVLTVPLDENVSLVPVNVEFVPSGRSYIVIIVGSWKDGC